MAWEWVAPVSSAVVGVAGIGATYLVGHQSRAAQDRAQRALFLEERRKDIFAQRRAVYAEYLTLVRKVHVLSLAQGGVADALNEHVRSTIEDVMRERRDGTPYTQGDFEEVEVTVRRMIAEKYDFLSPTSWAAAIGEIAGVDQRLKLLAGDDVRAHAKRVMSAVLLTMNPRSTLKDEDREVLDDLPIRISALTEAMSREMGVHADIFQVQE